MRVRIPPWALEKEEGTRPWPGPFSFSRGLAAGRYLAGAGAGAAGAGAWAGSNGALGAAGAGAVGADPAWASSTDLEREEL